FVETPIVYVMPDNRIRFSNPSDLQEGEFLVSGDNDSSLVQPSFNVPTGFTLRFERSWRVREFGEAGTITLDFDLTGLSTPLGQPGRYVLLRDDDGDFTNATELNTSIASLTDSVLQFTDINLSNGDYFTLAYREGVQVRPKVILSGAYNAGDGLMKDDLRVADYLPAEEPYEANAKFVHVAYGGGEVADTAIFNLSGNDAIVDWVFVELRDATDTSVVATRSALVQRDGDVVDVDGTSPVFFPTQASGDYFVAIRHRNHLPVMTEQAISLGVSSTDVDFSDPATTTFGIPQKLLNPSTNGMWAGDANQDEQLIFQGLGNDPQLIFLEVLLDPSNPSFSRSHVSNGYLDTDINMDGRTIFQGANADVSTIFINILTFPANTSFSRSYVVDGKLP
ncbi:MAG: hypothetical protein AAFQ87_06300, partial [Bacteroidota bacterium]